MTAYHIQSGLRGDCLLAWSLKKIASWLTKQIWKEKSVQVIIENCCSDFHGSAISERWFVCNLKPLCLSVSAAVFSQPSLHCAVTNGCSLFTDVRPCHLRANQIEICLFSSESHRRFPASLHFLYVFKHRPNTCSSRADVAASLSSPLAAFPSQPPEPDRVIMWVKTDASM